jgi:hypothetical protein
MKAKLLTISLLTLFSASLKASYFDSVLTDTARAYERIYDLYDQKALKQEEIESLKKGYSDLIVMDILNCRIKLSKKKIDIDKSSCEEQLTHDYNEFAEEYESLGISQRSFNALKNNVNKALKK